MAKNLEVKNLRISFRTNNGKVQAVRDISFDLEKGRTLAIVGESGSGKSVTSRAIMGILAANSIIEGGEIVYDGKDLLNIAEDEMYKIRGDKIAMIFQDPLSSLNPIMRIGKQITEAMLLKNKASRRDNRKLFNTMLALMRKNMIAADPANEENIKKMIGEFDKFCIQANRMENGYNADYSRAIALSGTIEDFLFMTGKKQKVDVRGIMNEISHNAGLLKDPYFLATNELELKSLLTQFEAVRRDYVKGLELPQSIVEVLNALKTLLDYMAAQTKPNFFRIGYYKLHNPEEDLHTMPVAELNAMTLQYLDAHFMNAFIVALEKAVHLSFQSALEHKKAVLAKLADAKTFFEGEFTRAEALRYANALGKEVDASIDRMEIVKDNMAYTFRIGLTSAIDKYFAAMKRNPKEAARFKKQTAKRERLLARGKKVDWKVVPMTLYDLDELKSVMVTLVDRLYAGYAQAPVTVDAHEKAIAIIDYMKDKASRVVYKVTRSMAKERAIKLMEEVGIAEARRRFNQYPFEFSGGMRQRIVIAIALSADPEILICDEPTTALDVTIQAQILELINNLKRERNLSVIFITHDLGVVANMADDIAVMYAGKIVEYGTAEDVFYDPRHPYTWALLSSMPDLDTKEKLDAIPGTPPNMIYPPVGDAFADRNKYAMQIDFEEQPPMFQITETHKAATWLLHPDAPHVDVPKAITDRIARMKKAGGADNG